jgi:anti-anti-sigma factor
MKRLLRPGHSRIETREGLGRLSFEVARGWMMRVRTERVDTAWVLHPEGRLVVEEDTRHLHELVRAVVQVDPGNVVLDLGNVAQLDCCGIGQLVRLRNDVCRSGGVFVLFNVEPRQKHLLDLLGLLPVLGVVDSRREAVAGGRGTATPSRPSFHGVPPPALQPPRITT